MKKNENFKKLTLHKITVARLEHADLNNLRGGYPSTKHGSGCPPFFNNHTGLC